MLRAFSHDFIKQHRHAGSQQKGLFIWRNKMEELANNLGYDSGNGFLYWLSRPANRIKVGDKVGGKAASNGYLVVKFKGKTYLYHRVCWRVFYGNDPTGQIDHINGNKTDNRICNLRDVDRRINSENLRKPNARNKSGYLGVAIGKRAGTYEAYIESRGKKYFLGVFENAKCAHEAYVKKKREIHKGCTL